MTPQNREPLENALTHRKQRRNRSWLACSRSSNLQNYSLLSSNSREQHLLQVGMSIVFVHVEYRLCLSEWGRVRVQSFGDGNEDVDSFFIPDEYGYEVLYWNTHTRIPAGKWVYTLHVCINNIYFIYFDTFLNFLWVCFKFYFYFYV